MPDTTWLVMNAMMLGFGGAITIKALWSRESGRYVFAWWDGGLLLRGRRVAAMPMVFGGIAAILAPLGLDAWVLWHQHPEFACPVPSGWVDVSEGAPEGNLDRIPSSFVSYVREQRRKVRVLAVDTAGPEPSRPAGLYSAEEVNNSVVVTPGLLDDVFAVVRKGAPPNAPIRLRAQQVLQRDGRRVGQIDASMTVEGTQVDSRILVLAGRRHYLLLTCLARQPEFSRCSAVLDEALERVLSQTAPESGS